MEGTSFTASVPTVLTGGYGPAAGEKCANLYGTLTKCGDHRPLSEPIERKYSKVRMLQATGHREIQNVRGSKGEVGEMPAGHTENS